MRYDKNQFTVHRSQFTKAIAFTLAETLIVMGVIGIVSALTLPNLNSSTGDKEKIARLQKTYTELTDAIDRAVAVYGPYDTWPDVNSGCSAPACPNRVAGRILEYMKVTKDCGTENNATCFINTPLAQQINYMGTKTGGWSCFGTGNYKAIFASGLSLSMSPSSSEIRIFVDADGPNKAKNAWGDDLFVFHYTLDKGLYPLGDYTDNASAMPCGFSAADDNCAYWVITRGNMDYKKTSDGKTCKGSSVVLNWTSNYSCK